MFGSDISPTNQVWKNPRSAFKRARKELHNETNHHKHWQIFGGRYYETRRFFTSCLFYSLPYSLLCKCIEFPLPTILPPYSDQENLTKYSLSSQVLMFGSILPISLQQIEYEKLYAVHSNELAKSYIMKPISIFIDTLKYDLWEFNKNRPFFTVFCPYLFKKSHI